MIKLAVSLIGFALLTGCGVSEDLSSLSVEINSVCESTSNDISCTIDETSFEQLSIIEQCSSGSCWKIEKSTDDSYKVYFSKSELAKSPYTYTSDYEMQVLASDEYNSIQAFRVVTPIKRSAYHSLSYDSNAEKGDGNDNEVGNGNTVNVGSGNVTGGVSTGGGDININITVGCVMFCNSSSSEGAGSSASSGGGSTTIGGSHGGSNDKHKGKPKQEPPKRAA